MNYQSLEKLTRWGRLSGFYLAPDLDSVRRIEQGENIPQSETLAKLAAAHGLELNEYMSELAKRSKQEAAAP